MVGIVIKEKIFPVENDPKHRGAAVALRTGPIIPDAFSL